MNIKKYIKDNLYCDMCHHQMTFFVAFSYADASVNIFKPEKLGNEIIFKIYKCNHENISLDDYFYFKYDKIHFSSDDIRSKILEREYKLDLISFGCICDENGIVEFGDDLSSVRYYCIGDDYCSFKSSNEFMLVNNVIKPYYSKGSTKLINEDETFSTLEINDNIATVYSITLQNNINKTYMLSYNVSIEQINSIYDMSNNYFDRSFNFLLDKRTINSKQKIINKVKNCMVML